jgi:Bacterial regulatory helix-turn-helix protein, lysR family
MDLKQLKTFVEVADNGSYARTANLVGTAQSALSRQLSALERGLGGRLFHRNGRGVVLTELGRACCPAPAHWSLTPPRSRKPRCTNAPSRTAKSRSGWCLSHRAG